MNISVFSDLHVRGLDDPRLPRFETAVAAAALKAEAILVLGDLVESAEDGTHPQVYPRLRAGLEKSGRPWLVLPGNHDPLFAEFFRWWPPVTGHLDLVAVRFIPFADEARPLHQGLRSSDDLARMESEASGGRIRVALQHMSVHPPGTVPSCPYNVENADAVTSRLERHGYALSIGGHYHAGFSGVVRGVMYLGIPAFRDDAVDWVDVSVADDGGIMAAPRRLH